MTVAELIEKLELMAPDARVWLIADTCEDYASGYLCSIEVDPRDGDVVLSTDGTTL